MWNDEVTRPRERDVGALEPALSEAPEMREAPIAGATDVRVFCKGFGWGDLGCGCECAGSDLAVDVRADSLLKHACSAAHSMIDRGIEMHERDWSREICAAGQRPISPAVDLTNSRPIDPPERSLEGLAVRRRNHLSSPCRKDCERDALVCRTTGVMGIIVVSALHLEHVGERVIEAVPIEIMACAVRRRSGRPAQPQELCAVALRHRHRIALIAADEMISPGSAAITKPT